MITVKNVRKQFPGGVQAVKDISFQIEKGEVLVLVGLSGSGKTTTLKMINRLVTPDAGEICINDINILDWQVTELRRSIGYVIQGIGLFPHLTIAENVGMVPTLKKWPRHNIEAQVANMLGMVGLRPPDFAHRYPDQLSGGQQQRVGVARALAANPDILLMDEPFGALDPLTREELQDEFLSLQQKLKLSVLLVTHDIFEAYRLGNRIAIMKDGAIKQIGYPEQLLEHPNSDYVSRLVGRHRKALRLSLITNG
jgi:osmoprotectant transport system ATP-binding protein